MTIADTLRIVAAGLTLLLGSAPAGATGDEPTCAAFYGGFDTRLIAELVGVLPAGIEPIGFEIAPAGPVVATRTTLYAVRKEGTVSLPAPVAVSAIAVDAAGRLALQAGASVSLVGPRGLEPVEPWARVVEGRILNSGQPSFIEAISANGKTRLGARSLASAAVLPIAELDGDFRGASWTPHGLVAVVGTSLMRWNPDLTSVQLLASDKGLSDTTDTCAIDADRVVVSQPHATLIFTGKAVTVVAALGGRCRVAGDDLYVVDAKLRQVWRLAGVLGVGGRDRDRAYAERLVRLGVTQSLPFQKTPEFAEAVRLIGCQEAMRMANEQRR